MTAAPADRAAVLAATLREVLDTFGPMREVYGGPVSYYDGSADIEPEQYERWRAVLDAEPAPAAELRHLADEQRDEREAQANLDTLADLLPRMADEAQPAEVDEMAASLHRDGFSTAETAAMLGTTPTAYRAASHRAAVEQIRAAAQGLYADAGIRVVAALDEEQR